MLRTTLHTAAMTAACLFLASCGAGKIEKWQDATGERYRTLRPAASLEGVTVPVLRSQGLERVWGAPKIERDGLGGYTLTYADPRQPFTRLMIHGMTRPLPRLSTPPKLAGEEMHNNSLTAYQRSQDWRTVMVVGQKVRWFQETSSGGADGAYFSTEGFTLKTADGKKGFYRMVAEGGDDATETIARWFGSVSLQ